MTAPTVKIKKEVSTTLYAIAPRGYHFCPWGTGDQKEMLLERDEE